MRVNVYVCTHVCVRRELCGLCKVKPKMHSHILHFYLLSWSLWLLTNGKFITLFSRNPFPCTEGTVEQGINRAFYNQMLRKPESNSCVTIVASCSYTVFSTGSLSRTTSQKAVFPQKQTHMDIVSWSLTKVQKQYEEAKIVFLTNDTRKTGHARAKKWT